MKRKKKIIIAASIAMVAITAILLISLFFLGVGVNASLSEIIVDAPFYDTTIKATEIVKIELYKDINYGMKLDANSFLGVVTGKCKNIEFGTYISCVHKSNTTCIAVLKDDGFYTVFNLENEEKTVELYEKLLTLYRLN
ncbi:MAG: hypothetical protein IJZ93_05995 [Clostridia bacterium]|nr:hypothetical protein [Clostridia bacterium]